MALGFFDIGCPLGMIGHRIHTEPNNFGIALGKLGLEYCHVTEFSGAYGGKVFGVRKQNRPTVADPLMKANRALCGFGGEIGRRVIDTRDGGYGWS